MLKCTIPTWSHDKNVTVQNFSQDVKCVPISTYHCSFQQKLTLEVVKQWAIVLITTPDMLHFLDVTSSHNERAASWEIKKHAKTTCLRLLFLNHIYFCSYYRVGLGVVQIVRYFKTSWSITVTAPPNWHFKSDLRWHIQNQRQFCSGGSNEQSFRATQ